MHEQGSCRRAVPLRARHPGLFHGHGHASGAFNTPGGTHGAHGAHGGIVGAFQKLGDLVGGLFGFGKPGQGDGGHGGKDTPPPGHSPPPAHPPAGGGGADGSSSSKPSPLPGQAPPPRNGAGADDSHNTGAGGATPTTPGAAHGGGRPSTTGRSTSPTAIAQASSPPIHSITRPTDAGSPYPSLSALSAPPAQSPAPGAGTPSTGNNQTSSSSSTAKGFPLAAAGVLGAVLSFLVVSGIIWGFWSHLRARKRRRANSLVWDFRGPSERMQSSFLSSGTLSTSTIPLFINAREAGRRDAGERRSGASSDAEHDAIPSPFAHGEDEREVDPFDSHADADAGTLRRGSTRMTVSTMSV